MAKFEDLNIKLSHDHLLEYASSIRLIVESIEEGKEISASTSKSFISYDLTGINKCIVPITESTKIYINYNNEQIYDFDFTITQSNNTFLISNSGIQFKQKDLMTTEYNKSYVLKKIDNNKYIYNG